MLIARRVLIQQSIFCGFSRAFGDISPSNTSVLQRCPNFSEFTPNEIWDVLDNPDFEIRPINLAAALNHLAKLLSGKDQDKLLALQQRITPTVSSMQIGEITHCFSALCRIRRYDLHFVFALQKRALNFINEFSGHEISEIFFGCAIQKNFDAPLLVKLAAVLPDTIEDLNASEISHILFSLSVFKMHQHKKLAVLLCDAAIPLAEDLSFQHIPQTLVSITSLQIHSHKFIDKLLARAEKHAQEFQVTQASQLLDVLAQLHKPSSEFAKQLCNGMIGSKIPVRVVTITLSALADLGVYNKDLVTKLRALALNHALKFTSLEIGNALNALLRFGVEDKELIERLCQVTLASAEKFNGNGATKVLNFLAKLKVKDPPLARKLCEVALKKSASLDTTLLPTALSAVAQLGVTDADIIKGFCDIIWRRLDKLNASQSLIILAALLKLGVNNDVTTELQRIAKRKLKDVHFNDIAATFAAIDSFEPRGPLMDELCQLTKTRAKLGNAGLLTDIMLAVSKLEVKPTDVFEALYARRIAYITPFTPKDIGNILTAINAFPNVKTKGLAAPLYRATESRVREFDAESLGIIFSALAAALPKKPDKKLLKSLCEEVQDKIPTFNLRLLVTTLHNIAKLGAWNTELFDAARVQLQNANAAEMTPVVAGILSEINSMLASAQPSLAPLSPPSKPSK